MARLANKSAFNHEKIQSWATEGSEELSQSVSQRTKRVIIGHCGGNYVVGAKIQNCGQPNLKARLTFKSRAKIRSRPWEAKNGYLLDINLS